jgi:pimeloyl-ACP methyl ester carboxylesterase
MPFVLVHSAGFDARIWRRVTPHLAAPSLAVDLPGRRCPGSGEGPLCLDAYAESVASDVIATDWTDVVLVGHGFAAVLLPRVAARVPGLLARLVFVSGALTPQGDPVRAVDLRRLPATFSGLVEEDVRLARGLTVPEPLRIGLDRGDLTGLRYPVPRTWVRLDEDRVVPPARQDDSARRSGCDEVVALQAPHLAMVAVPEELAGILNRVHARSVGSPPPRQETLTCTWS